MVYCDHQELFVVYCDHQVVIFPLLWVCVHPSSVEVIVVWLSALSLLCRGDYGGGWLCAFIPLV